MIKSLIAVPCIIALLGLGGCNTTETTYANNYPYSVGYVNLNPGYWGNGAYYNTRGWGWNNNHYWRNHGYYNNYRYHHAGYYNHDGHHNHYMHHHGYHHGMHHNGHHR